MARLINDYLYFPMEYPESDKLVCVLCGWEWSGGAILNNTHYLEQNRMATGYTEPVQTGKITEFKDFAMYCARAFGALITMRDDRMDAPVPDRLVPDSYHEQRITEAKERLRKATTMSLHSAKGETEREYERATGYYHDAKHDSETAKNNYNNMLAKVHAWTPPPDIVCLKNFMIEQLTESIKFDCNYTVPTPKKKTAEEWLAAEKESAEKDVKYHEKEWDEECKRTDERNKWLQNLRDSLK